MCTVTDSFKVDLDINYGIPLSCATCCHGFKFGYHRELALLTFPVPRVYTEYVNPPSATIIHGVNNFCWHALGLIPREAREVVELVHSSILQTLILDQVC